MLKNFHSSNYSQSFAIHWMKWTTFFVFILLALQTKVSASITGSGDFSPTNPAGWTLGTDIFIGKDYAASLSVTNGSELKSKGGFIGYNAGSSGTVTISDSGSKWSYSGIPFSNYYDQTVMFIGYSGNGTINLQSGGTINNDNNKCAYLGYNLGAYGTISVTGNGSTFNNTDLYAGYSGNGALNITGGGQVTTSGAYLGYSSGSTGTASVVGSGSKWTSGVLYVGNEGSGTLTVSNGGVVTTRLYASLNSLYGNGSITANGGILDANLVFDASHDLQNTLTFGTAGTLTYNAKSTIGVGYKQNGTLQISGGVTISSYDGFLGYHSGSQGVATVSGLNTKWTLMDTLWVGNKGDGFLTIANGAQITSGTGSLGTERGSSGTVSINGPDAKWTIELGDLYVGEHGNGILYVQGGGQVINSNSFYISYLGYFAGSTGTATVSGLESKWINNNPLYVGDGGSGEMNIDTGGLVTAGTLTLAYHGTSTGTVNINSGGTLQTKNITRGQGIANFNWNDGIIRNYDATTDSTISNVELKLAATGTHAFLIDGGRTENVNAVLRDSTTNGSLTKTGAGTLILSMVNTYSGPTTIEAGRFKVTGSVLNTSEISVAQSGILELAKTSGSATSAKVLIDNAGSMVVSVGTQQVGSILGSGSIHVLTGAKLTALSLVQDTLIIGGFEADIADAPETIAVPEPSAIVLLLIGIFGGYFISLWRHKRLKR